MKYHHMGIPTEVEQTGEIYLPDYKLYCTDHERNPFGIQWMRYESDCPLPDLVKTKAHVAFEVDDLAEALKGHEILIEPNSPSEGLWWLSWSAMVHRWSSSSSWTEAPGHEARVNSL